MKQQSDLVVEEAFSVLTAVGWDTRAKDCRATREPQQRYGGFQRHGRARHHVGAVSYRRLENVPK